jgi:kynurenine formamidase
LISEKPDKKIHDKKNVIIPEKKFQKPKRFINTKSNKKVYGIDGIKINDIKSTRTKRLLEQQKKYIAENLKEDPVP